MHAATLSIQYVSATEAQQAGQSLAPDNEGHVTWHVHGTSLILQAKAESVLGLVRSLDDALGCLRAAGAN